MAGSASGSDRQYAHFIDRLVRRIHARSAESRYRWFDHHVRHANHSVAQLAGSDGERYWNEYRQRGTCQRIHGTHSRSTLGNTGEEAAEQLAPHRWNPVSSRVLWNVRWISIFVGSTTYRHGIGRISSWSWKISLWPLNREKKYDVELNLFRRNIVCIGSRLVLLVELAVERAAYALPCSASLNRPAAKLSSITWTFVTLVCMMFDRTSRSFLK